MKKEAVLILPNIRSTYNVGAIFRTADAAGINKIYLVGYTPAPVDEFGRADSGIAKTALGAEKTINWEKVASTTALIKKLKKTGFQIIALEQAKNSVDYKKVKPKFPCAMILGEEVSGLSPAILKNCDLIAEIPMQGQKESLNVSVAAGIALFRILGV
ncbi:MAG: RNA methyltransferase [Candidatus Vogelbacteria bacterium]|nr:RNA methyltransferase [Candidatus Vogelbacteria bacterium]